VRGRKRNSGAREPSGRLARMTKEQREAEVLEVAIRNRLKDMVHPDDAKNQLTGSAFGRLCWRGDISRQQYDSGVAWAYTVHRFNQVVGFGAGLPKTSGVYSEMVSYGLSTDPDPDLKAVEELKSEINNIRREIRDHCSAYAAAALSVLRDVILADRHERSLNAKELGNLRCGLNALVRHYRR
jgi:hypothetical protein